MNTNLTKQSHVLSKYHRLESGEKWSNIGVFDILLINKTMQTILGVWTNVDEERKIPRS